MGNLSWLLKWNTDDPPSSSEVDRNFDVCRKYQSNRNPFVDYPHLVDYIWNSENYFDDGCETQCPEDSTDAVTCPGFG